MAQERSLQTYQKYLKKWDKYEEQVREYFENKEINEYMGKEAAAKAKLKKLKIYVAASSPHFMMDLISKQGLAISQKAISLAKSIDNDSDLLKGVKKENDNQMHEGQENVGSATASNIRRAKSAIPRR